MLRSHSESERWRSHRYAVQAIVSSVGPYRFSKVLCAAAQAHASAKSAGRGSPQNRLQRRVGKAPGFSEPRARITNATEGTENHTVKRESWIKWAGFSNALRDGQHRQAPASQATNISKAERSNVRSKVCENRSN